jgi:acyl-CoA hydrolase
MEPGHANFLQKVFGGAILSMIDLAAYTTASRFAGNICVTASFDRVDFHEPIEVGEVVTMEGLITFAGRTSCEVTVEVWAENILTREKRHTNTARVTMVAIKDGKPVAVPVLICENREDKVRFLSGKLRKERRFIHRAEFDRLVASMAAKSESELDALLKLDKLVEALNPA